MNYRNKLLTACLALMLISAGLSYTYLNIKNPNKTGKLKMDEALPNLPNYSYINNNISLDGFRNIDLELFDHAKIRSSTKITRRIIYECGHEEISSLPAPREMVGLSGEALAKQIAPWIITEFSEKEIILLQKRQGISPSCLNTMHIGEKDGWVTVFYGTPEKRCKVKSTTRIEASNLPKGELEDLKTGIPITDQEELLHILEALASWSNG